MITLLKSIGGKDTLHSGLPQQKMVKIKMTFPMKEIIFNNFFVQELKHHCTFGVAVTLALGQRTPSQRSVSYW